MTGMGGPRVHILRLVLLALAGLAAIVGGAALVHLATHPDAASPSMIDRAATRPGEPGATPHELAAARRAFAETLKSAPEYAAFFERLQSLFPSDYESFLAGFAKRFAARGEMGSADLLMVETVRSLRLSRGGLAAKAGSPALEHIFELQASMLRALGATDPHLCVDFLNGAESASFFEFSAQNRGLLAAMGMAGLDAIHDGEVQQVKREPPTQVDFDALEQALRERGLDSTVIGVLLDGKTSDPPIADAEMCRAGQIYLDALAAMPEPARLRIYGFAVELMARM